MEVRIFSRSFFLSRSVPPGAAVDHAQQLLLVRQTQHLFLQLSHGEQPLQRRACPGSGTGSRAPCPPAYRAQITLLYRCRRSGADAGRRSLPAP